MTCYRWPDRPRELLSDVLPEALVVLAIGAVEQHGPHLPTGTDTLIVEAITAAAVQAVADRAARDLVVVPAIAFGASDHHFPFGGTLSLTAETATAVLVDLLRSVGRAGASRVLVVNGHGGNRGPCHSATHIASTRYGLHVGYLDYWTLLPDDPAVPGHAGAFETSLVSHLHPELVSHLHPELVGPLPPERTAPDVVAVADVALHTETLWRALDGYTDNPADADAAAGRRWFERCAAALGDRIVALAAQL